MRSSLAAGALLLCVLLVHAHPMEAAGPAAWPVAFNATLSLHYPEFGSRCVAKTDLASHRNAGHLRSTRVPREHVLNAHMRGGGGGGYKTHHVSMIIVLVVSTALTPHLLHSLLPRTAHMSYPSLLFVFSPCTSYATTASVVSVLFYDWARRVMMLFINECPVQTTSDNRPRGGHSCTYLYTDHGVS